MAWADSDEAAERVSDKHVSLQWCNVLQYRGKLGDDPIERSRARRRVAPRQAGAIYRADAGELRDCWLDDGPTE